MRRPIVRFAALGALLFALLRAVPWRAPNTDRAPVAASVAATRAVPDDEALLASAALALGFLERDPVALRRLSENLRAAEPPGAAPGEGSAAAASSDVGRADEAMALGMQDVDLVVRRRLANQLRLRAAAGARAVAPDDAALRAHLAAHADRFRIPETRRLRVVSLARERHPALAADAARLAARLRAGAADPAAAGDALPLPSAFEAICERELAALYGAELARAAFRLTPGAWSAPIRSPLGLHFVAVGDVTPGRPAELEEVRAAVREDVLAEREARALARMLERLRAEARGHGASSG